MSDATSHFFDIAETFSGNFDEFSEISCKTFERISQVRMLSIFNLLKQEIILFLQQGYRLLEVGVERDQVNVFEKPIEQTPLGTWLHGEGRAEYGHLPSFDKLLTPYSEMHDCYKQVMSIVFSNDWVGNDQYREQVLTTFHRAQSLSCEFVRLVDLLVDEKKRFESSAGSEQDAGEIELF